MIEIKVNGRKCQVNAEQSLGYVVEMLGYETDVVAVAVNGRVIKKSLYGDTIIVEGDQLAIVTPMQGG